VLAPLGGQPLLWWTLRALLQSRAALGSLHLTEIIVAARPDEWNAINGIFRALSETAPDGSHSAPSTQHSALFLVPGGDVRQDSVANAVASARGDFVMVHDAARPLASPALIARVCGAAQRDGAAIPALPASDTVKATAIHDGRVIIKDTLPRETIWLAQTPQVFRRELLAGALSQATADSFIGTDCASLVERFGHPVTVVEGEAGNLKVTYSADLERAAALLSSR
jgi:2-C-methyl-D-erythritol 4-phosphate cytidylyltransferase